MKRCQKCNRTFPDENQKFCTIDGGLLVSADQGFDPNATIQSTAAQVGLPPVAPTRDETVDLNATIATPSTAETAVLPRKTGPTGGQTVSRPPSATQAAQPPQASQPPQQPQPPQAARPPQATPPRQAQPPQPSRAVQSPTPPRQQSAPLPPGTTATAKKKSKLPLILGILAVLLVLGIGAVAALFFLVIKPRLDQRQSDVVATRPDTRPEDANVNNNSNSNSNTNQAETPTTPAEPEFVPPPDAIRFENSQANLDGKLAEHYLDFSFYYPKTWSADPKSGVAGATTFAKVERRLPPDFTQENFAVGWYESQGTVAADQETFPRLVERLNATLSKNLPEYRKVSEGPTKVNSLDAYEFRFVGLSKGTDKGDLHLWGRVIFLPPGAEGATNGATLSMLTTSLAPELSGVEDVGEKGEMPVILESFRFGKKP